jgi:hypothetical protein
MGLSAFTERGNIFSIMGERRLRITAYRHSIPSYGVCEKCGFTVKVRNELMTTPDVAREQFNIDFANHKCKPEDTNQAAARESMRNE